MKCTVKKVVEWGRARNINEVYPQLGKVMEELGELAHEINRDCPSALAVQDAIGDTLVTLIILADILGYDIEECLKLAYNDIKDRKGHTDNGMFIKEEQ